MRKTFRRAQPKPLARNAIGPENAKYAKVLSFLSRTLFIRAAGVGGRRAPPSIGPEASAARGTPCDTRSSHPSRDAAGTIHAPVTWRSVRCPRCPPNFLPLSRYRVTSTLQVPQFDTVTKRAHITCTRVSRRATGSRLVGRLAPNRSNSPAPDRETPRSTTRRPDAIQEPDLCGSG